MKQKVIKEYSELFKCETTFILDENMKQLPLSGSLARKVEEINEKFAKSKYKSVEEMLQRARDSSPE